MAHSTCQTQIGDLLLTSLASTDIMEQLPEVVTDESYTSEETDSSDISELNVLDDSFIDAVRNNSALNNVINDAEFSFTFDKVLNKTDDGIVAENCSENKDMNISLPSTNSSHNETTDYIQADNNNDKSYIPLTEQSNAETEMSNLSSNNVSLDKSITESGYNAGAPDDESMYVVTSGIRKRKSHFCVYCHTMQVVISRHLVTVHREEPEVKALLVFKPNSAKRKYHLKLLRLRGDYLFNSTTQYNDGEKLVTRQPNQRMNRKAKDFRLCHNCLGSYVSIHRHRIKCLGESSLRHRSNPIISRGIAGQIHENASSQLRKLFSVLRDDKITRAIRYDDLLITFANELCAKYTKQQQHDMIRARLRQLGKLLLELKNINEAVSDFSSVFNPKYYNDVIKAVKTITGCNEEQQKCDIPAVATGYGTYITKLAKTYKKECIKKEDYNQVKQVKYFLQIHEQEYPILVNNLAYETQTRRRRHKKIELPSMHDIKLFRECLENKFFMVLEQLQTEYSYEKWLGINKTTLILVLLFNRKRPGELERVSIEDYKNFAKFSEVNEEAYENLSTDQKKMVDKYIRFEIGGKLDRNVPVILSKEMQDGIEIILKHRKTAGVHDKNPFIFALPGYDNSGRHKHLRACALMREYAKECGATYPKTLRATLLRKHIATTVASMEIAEARIYDISNFMGHAEAIHRHHYRQPVISRDICEVSKILEAAIGIDNTRDMPLPINNTITNVVSEVENSKTANQKDLGNGNTSRSNYADKSHSNGEFCHDSEYVTESESSDAEEVSTKITNRNKKSIKNRTNKSKNGIENTKNRRTRWTDFESKTVMNAFQDNIKAMHLPTSKEIRQLLKAHPNLKRTEAQVRTWIHNQYAHKKRLTYC